MKPENNSRRLLSITQSKAKMYEYEIPEEFHINIEKNPSTLFSLAISLVGDYSARISSEESNTEELNELHNNLPFSARFFDSYFQANFDTDINSYNWLLGSVSYYLSDLPGSSLLLAKKIHSENFDLGGSGLENLLLWIMLGNYNNIPSLDDSYYKKEINNIYMAYQQFFSDGTSQYELYKIIKELRGKVYSIGTPRQLLLIDIISGITKRKIENSTWYCLPKYSGIPKEKWQPILKKKEFFIKELWPAQHLLGKQGVFQGKSAIIQMPTSAGKTKAAEIIIRSAFLSDRTNLTVIVAPFRALCHEIRENLVSAFRSEAILVNELTDVMQNDYSIENYIDRKQIIIVTPEKLNYLLRHNTLFSEHIGLVIFDEGHQFDNGNRGITYELLITSLKENLPEHVQSVLISAVISNGEEIGLWLNGENSENITGNDLIPTYRSLAFVSWMEKLGRLYFVNPHDIDVQEFFVPRLIDSYQLQLKGKEYKERYFPNKTNGKEIALFLALKVAKNGSVAIFCGTKTSVSSLCKIVVDAFDRKLPMEVPYKYSNRVEIKKLLTLHEINFGDNANVTKCAKLGIFSHHNNIPHGLRIAIEYALKEGLLNFVICTSTLAQGVNLPLRYLIVTSTYQGKEQIKVRDFQNLIGRTGRAKYHTEGSIIFSDPQVYDNHLIWNQKWRWQKVKRLLNPDHLEQCTSSLLSIFDPLEIDDKENMIYINSSVIIDLYPQGLQMIENYFTEYVKQFNYGNNIKKRLLEQASWKIHIISSIESYLLAHCDTDHPEIIETEAEELGKGTLAYFLAEDDKKEQIVNLFTLLAKNINQNVPESQKRIIFGRTLFGLSDSLRIYSWLENNISSLLLCENDNELLEILWPIIFESISNKSITSCSIPDVIKDIAFEWIKGKTFYELYLLMQESGAKKVAGSQLREYTIESIVDICENGFAYNGMLVLGAITDFVELFDDINPRNLINILQILQKKFKYGLENQRAIILYEMGFSDRVISSELSSVFFDLPPDREIIINHLLIRQEKSFDILDKYPSYFSMVYQNLNKRN